MKRLSTLHVKKNLVASPFGLLGTDENALTFALGYTFQQCPALLQWFLRQIEIPGVNLSSLQNARINLQRRRSGDPDSGITDIEIHLSGKFHVIIEAKVGLAVPTIAQCSKYLSRFHDTNEPVKRLVTLVESPDDSFVAKYRQESLELSKCLKCLNWSSLFTECIRLTMSKTLDPEAKAWVRSFYRFLDKEYKMKAFTTEVWILAINTDPLWPNGMSYWDIHQKFKVWWDYKEHAVRPLYIAFRVEGVVDSIWRVSRIEHGIPIVDVIPQMTAIKENWPNTPCTIWYLESPVKLPRPISTGGGMYNRRVRCDLDLLLSCESVLEIEKAMKKRRDQGGQ